MKQPRLPDPPPLKTNDVRAITVGIALWSVALLVLLAADLDHTHRWWIWTCATGIALGFFGLLYVRRRDRKTPKA
ncbi:DUF2530 domain-containing protein [Rhizohabitans arisaemae]|uniref:DUF2530 domain-containing protein n=1 Tax=Rhizohabitans arisaemae TaxID=2720610 RepID=UPI0024B059F2|nr:DUF2530 domain-containing protein [Rhizohabitans arisaemae]